MLGEIKVKIASDMMSASICIEEGTAVITGAYALEKLREAGVSAGVHKEKIKALIEAQAKGLWVDVAFGKPAGETIPGYFEFFFDNTGGEGKTHIDENGKVHYGKNRVLVNEGEKLALYHRSVSGTFGYTVMSSVVAPKPVKDIKLKPGEGVEKREDEYFAKTSGEVILTSESIEVKNVLVINGDAKYGVDSETEFLGDIRITGDVLSGCSIIAKGNIEVSGNVEACKLVSEKDIIIHGGVQGDNVATITAGGSITCPFVENATLSAGGSIHADYVMNSNLVSKDSIVIHGKRGAVIGGLLAAVNLVEADNVGNMAGTPTRLEIQNPTPSSIEYSRIVVHNKPWKNVRIAINGVSYRMVPGPQEEFHLCNGSVVTCDIGKYVPQRLQEKAKPEKKTVLLVDDEPIILKTFFSFLHEYYDVLLVSSAKDARNLLESRNHAPDLILLDLLMPEMNGAEFLQSMRKCTWRTYSGTPVFFVTAVSDSDVIQKCMTLYPQGYLVKPLGREDLLKAVDKFFGITREY